MISAAALLHKIQDFVEQFIQQWPEVFWVEARTTPGNKITILLDADNGLNIEKCTAVNRALYKHIEAENYFPGGNFSLEVSSPGTDRPLTLHRQYQKNIGRKVEVALKNGEKVTGMLREVDKESILLETGSKSNQSKDKKAEAKQTTVLFDNIKNTKVLITF